MHYHNEYHQSYSTLRNTCFHFRVSFTRHRHRHRHRHSTEGYHNTADGETAYDHREPYWIERCKDDETEGVEFSQSDQSIRSVNQSFLNLQ